MEIGDIINLLLLVLFVVVGPIMGAITKRRKAAGANISHDSSQDGAQGFENILQSFGDEIEALRKEKSDEFEKERLSNAEQSDENVPPFLTNEIEYLPADDKNTRLDSSITDLNESFPENVNKKTDEIEPENSFDIKKAVIFSEILNTKYF